MLRHLINLTNNRDESPEGSNDEEYSSNGCVLDDWTYSEPPTAVFQSIYGYLDEEWGNIPASAKASLKGWCYYSITCTSYPMPDMLLGVQHSELPCIPVGNRLVKASRLYFRLTQDLSPFMFEVPRVFGAYDRLFKEMGTKPSPSIQVREEGTVLQALLWL